MANIVPVFGYAHPFWNRALEMRKEYHSIAQITKAANEEGYDVTYKQVSLGLSKAPMNLGLPAKTSKWLRTKYGEYDKQFNSFTAMRDLAQEALAKAGEAEDELEFDDPNMTHLRRQHLENFRDKWLKNAFDWSKECSRLEIEMGALLAAAENNKRDDSPRVIDATVVDSIVDEFKSSMPTISESMLAHAYGGDNIRMTDDGLEHDTDDD